MTRRLAVTVYLTPDVYARLKHEADQAGTLVSELMAGYLEGYAVRFPLPPAPAPVKRSKTEVERSRYRERTSVGEETEAIAVVYGVTPDRVRRLRDLPTEQLQIIQQARTREGS